METLILKPIQNAIPNRWTKLKFNTKDILIALAVVVIVLLFWNSVLSFVGTLLSICSVVVIAVAYELHQIIQGDYDLTLDNIDLYNFDKDLWR